MEVFNSVECKERANNGRDIFGVKDVGDGGVMGNGVDKEDTLVVAYDVGRGCVVVMLENVETACEGWKEGESGGKGVLQVLDMVW